MLTEFKRLFREARREHSKHGRNATAESPAHQAAVKFAQQHGIPGAEELLVALPVYWNEKDSAKALSGLDKMGGILPKELTGHLENVRGLLLQNLKQFDEAIACYQKAMASPGFDTPGYALTDMGLAYADEGEQDRAIECFQQALATPDFDAPGHALNNIGVAYGDKGEQDRAIECYQQALATPDFDAPGHALNNMGLAYAAKGEQDRAIEYYQKAFATPSYGTPGYALNNMGNAYAAQGEQDRAIECYQQALATPGYDTPHRTRLNLVNSLRELQKFPEALTEVNRVLAEPDTDNQHPRARFIKGLIEEAMAGLKPTPADEALAMAATAKDSESPEQRILEKLRGQKDKYHDYLLRECQVRDNVFSCLRGWSSAVTLLEGGTDCRWSGGGYFIKWQGKGIVLDPGFDFLDNFHNAGFNLREADAVLVSHNHGDHNDDLKSLDHLRYEIFRRWKPLKPDERNGLDLSHCLFVMDEDTAKTFPDEAAEHRGSRVIMQRSDCEHKQWKSRLNGLPVTIEHFMVKHGAEVPHAVGLRLRLHADGKPDFVVGYAADTRYFDGLAAELKDCDILLGHISMPDEEEYDKPDYLKGDRYGKGSGVHLGYNGLAKLINETNAKLVLVGEFWAGLVDLRIDLIKGLRRKTNDKVPILPIGLGFHLHLPTLEVDCTGCGKPVPLSGVKIAPAAIAFGPLGYLCPACLG